jgi:hypothetical protein
VSANMVEEVRHFAGCNQPQGPRDAEKTETADDRHREIRGPAEERRRLGRLREPIDVAARTRRRGTLTWSRPGQAPEKKPRPLQPAGARHKGAGRAQTNRPQQSKYRHRINSRNIKPIAWIVTIAEIEKRPRRNCTASALGNQGVDQGDPAEKAMAEPRLRVFFMAHLWRVHRGAEASGSVRRSCRLGADEPQPIAFGSWSPSGFPPRRRIAARRDN